MGKGETNLVQKYSVTIKDEGDDPRSMKHFKKYSSLGFDQLRPPTTIDFTRAAVRKVSPRSDPSGFGEAGATRNTTFHPPRFLAACEEELVSSS